MRLPAGPPDDDLLAAVMQVHERVRARIRALRHTAPGPSRPIEWNARARTARARDWALPVDEVIDIALACLAALASSGATDVADRIGLASDVDRAGPAASGPPLTTREQEAVRLVAEGLSNKQIAQALHITQRTVKMHIASAMNKLGAANRAHAAVLATQMRLL
jgi:DNA-binding CsgD family transcriptional regulator